jgi:uncharacterized protein YdaT
LRALALAQGFRGPQARRLPPLVRLKAIEIANALLAEGCDDGKAIRIGIAKARQWALRRM